MTLIGRLRADGAPLYFGDVLLSAEGSPQAPFSVPAVDDVHATLRATSVRQYVGARQKLNLIGDRLVVAWAGNFWQAHAIARELRQAVEDGAWSIDDALHVLRSMDEDRTSDVSIIGSIITHRTDHIHYAHFNWEAEQHEISGIDVRLAGSGSRAALEALRHIIKPPFPPNPVDTVRSIGVVVQSHLVGVEMMTGANLSEWWGGAIEIALPLDGKAIDKLTSHLHTYWTVLSDDGATGALRFEHRVVLYHYVDQCLVATVARWAHNSTKTMSYHNYVYRPLLGQRLRKTEAKHWLPDSWSHTTCGCFITIVNKSNGSVNFLSLVETGNDQIQSVAVTVDEQEFRIELYNSFIARVADFVNKSTGILLSGF